MMRRWLIALGFVLLWMAAPPHLLTAAKKKPAARPASAKTNPKKPKKSAASKNARPVPAKPPADIPAVTEEASVWQGCLEPRDLPVLASTLGMDETRLGPLLAEEGLVASWRSECVPYAAATGGEGGVASAIFERTEPKEGESPVLAVRKMADGVTVTPAACDCPEQVRRELAIPARDLKDLSSEAIASLPKNVRWQLSILVPQMIAKIPSADVAPKEPALNAASAEPAADGTEESISQETIPQQANPQDAIPQETIPQEAGANNYTVRVAIERDGDGESERLQSVEILESATGKRVDAVWWLARPGGPGVFIGMDGLAYERALWQSPVKYDHKSRGVGPATTTVRQRTPASKGGAIHTVLRTLRIRGYHLGVDMVAPKGLDVHAVGDATVAFAGKQRGFGNLVILDHGRGYQTYYAHLSRIETGMKVGTKVAGGDIIGLVGSTGRSTAPHLHFETRKDSKYIDPFDETHQLDFWLLSADEQERLAMQLLTPAPTFAREAKVAHGEEGHVPATPKPATDAGASAGSQ